MEEEKKDEYENEIEVTDEIQELLSHLRMGDTKKYKNTENSQKFSQFLKDIEDVHIDKQANPIFQKDFENKYGKRRNLFQPIVIEGKDDEYIRGFFVVPEAEIRMISGKEVMKETIKNVLPSGREMLDNEIRYEMNDEEMDEFNDENLSNWSFDASEKEIERLSTMSPNIRALSDGIAKNDEMESVRFAERQDVVVSPDGRSASPHNQVGMNFGGWRLKKN